MKKFITCLLLVGIFTGSSALTQSFPDGHANRPSLASRMFKSIGKGTTKAVTGPARMLYKVTAYLVQEILRPVTALTHGLTNLFGVEEKVS